MFQSLKVSNSEIGMGGEMSNKPSLGVLCSISPFFTSLESNSLCIVFHGFSDF